VFDVRRGRLDSDASWHVWFLVGLRSTGCGSQREARLVLVFLCVLMYRAQLIPRWLAVSGLIGYPILAAGTIAEIFGIHIGLYLTIPGFFFEVVMLFWLIFKGFKPEVY